MHAAHVAVHGVGASCGALMVFAWSRARCAGVVVIDVATMCMAVVSIFECFTNEGGGVWLGAGCLCCRHHSRHRCRCHRCCGCRQPL